MVENVDGKYGHLRSLDPPSSLRHDRCLLTPSLVCLEEGLYIHRAHLRYRILSPVCSPYSISAITPRRHAPLAKFYTFSFLCVHLPVLVPNVDLLSVCSIRMVCYLSSVIFCALFMENRAFPHLSTIVIFCSPVRYVSTFRR